MASSSVPIRVENLSIVFGDTTVLEAVDFQIQAGEIFVIMGPSGCGKSSLMRAMLGLIDPVAGRVCYGEYDFFALTGKERTEFRRRLGVLFQGGALWNSLTLEENIALPLAEFTELSAAEIQDLSSLKLALVGLADHRHHYPSELSGGMRKRAALARALALDPAILFFDEPSAGLDPETARRMDELILELRASLDTTLIVISHELDSIYTIADRSLFLDPACRGVAAVGNPHELYHQDDPPALRRFLHRGQDSEEVGS